MSPSKFEKPSSSPQGEVVQYVPLRIRVRGTHTRFRRELFSQFTHRQLQKSAERTAAGPSDGASVRHEEQDRRTACALCTDKGMIPRPPDHSTHPGRFRITPRFKHLAGLGARCVSFLPEIHLSIYLPPNGSFEVLRGCDRAWRGALSTSQPQWTTRLHDRT